MQEDAILSGLIMELRRGTIVLCVLRELDTPMYGYNLVHMLSDNGISIEANTLYPLLRRLEGQGLLESTWETGGSKPRKYYVTTDKGKDIAIALKGHWDQTVASINKIWEGENHE